MRSYGQKILKNSAQKATRQAAESRDAILWDVLLNDRVCRCKIQGSNEYIIARFPQNWNVVPSWCKPGQAVRIAHKGGIRGYVEVIGYGRAIPTPVSGSSTPTITTPDNSILTGLEIKAIPQIPRMNVYVKTGTVRFDGITYTVPYALMSATSLIRMNMGLSLGDVAGVYAIDSVTTGKFRYSLFCIGPDLVIDHVKGTEFTSTEVKPDLPSGHLLIGYLLVGSGKTEITSADIAQIWTKPEPATISAVATNNGSAWSVVASVLDQYGNAITTSGGWTVMAVISGGDGSIFPASANTDTGNTCSFTYTEGTAGYTISVELSLQQGDYSAEGLVNIGL